MKRKAENSDSGARQNAPNAIKGSTMIAVLAAMLFIGVVTASMVKNTGSQSAASRSYSGMQVMSSTVRSGMIATETFFGTKDSANTLGLIIQSLNAKNDTTKQRPFIFGNGKEKKEINNGQHFSSQLRDIKKKDSVTARSYFEIKSGRTNNGKTLKKALAYYDMDVSIKTTAKYNAQNAIYFNGDVSDANNAMEVYGPATFEGSIKFQNTKAIFHGNAYFNKGVDFMKGAPRFEDKAYFNDYLNIQNLQENTAWVFDKEVGINGNFSTGGTDRLIRAKGDVWFNGVFKDPYGSTDNSAKLGGDSASTKFYYTSKLSMKTNAMCGMCPKEVNGHTPTCVSSPNPNTNTCCPHNCSHSFDQSDRIRGFVNMNRDSTSGYLGSNIDNIPQKMGMTTLEERRDPQLDITKIPANKSTTLSINGQKTLTLNELNTMYETASSNGTLYDGEHLVIKVNGGPLNFSTSSEKFDKKVIFVLENNATLNQQYFPTTNKSSTLIYVGPGNAKINNSFKLNGAFHGLIYIDTLNKGENHISFGAKDTLVGAIHSFSNQTLSWNTGDASAPPVIKFSKDVLTNYETLVKSSTENTYIAEYVDYIYKRIHLRPFGYYFY